MRFKVTASEAAGRRPLARQARRPQDDVSGRALGHPEVQRFQELFSGRANPHGAKSERIGIPL